MIMDCYLQSTLYSKLSIMTTRIITIRRHLKGIYNGAGIKQPYQFQGTGRYAAAIRQQCPGSFQAETQPSHPIVPVIPKPYFSFWMAKSLGNHKRNRRKHNMRKKRKAENKDNQTNITTINPQGTSKHPLQKAGKKPVKHKGSTRKVAESSGSRNYPTAKKSAKNKQVVIPTALNL